MLNVVAVWEHFFSSNDERMLLELDGLTSETASIFSKSLFDWWIIFHTHVKGIYIGQSNHGDSVSSNANLKKKINEF